MRKRLLSFALALLLTFALLPVPSVSGGTEIAPRAEDSGRCGDSLYWSFDGESGCLSVTGSGDMYDFYNDSGAPWSALSDLIKCASIGPEVTRIGAFAFPYCTVLESLVIGGMGENSRLASIGEHAFEGCERLSAVGLPASVAALGYNSFAYCSSLEKAVFYGAAPEAPEGIFADAKEGFRIFYPAAFADSWAPNGETLWHGYPIEAFFAEGDVNGDGSVTMADVSALVAYLMNSGSLSDACMGSADANGDGCVDILDATAVYSIAFGE